MGCTESKTKSNIKRNISLKNTLRERTFLLLEELGT